MSMKAYIGIENGFPMPKQRFFRLSACFCYTLEKPGFAGSFCEFICKGICQFKGSSLAPGCVEVVAFEGLLPCFLQLQLSRIPQELRGKMQYMTQERPTFLMFRATFEFSMSLDVVSTSQDFQKHLNSLSNSRISRVFQSFTPIFGS